MSEAPKVVPPRNNLRKQPVFAKNTIADVEGREKGFHYQWVEERDVNHPQHISRYLSHQRIGDPEIGYCEVEPWEVCTTKNTDIKGRQRDDQGKPIDTTIRHGSLVLVRTTDDNHAVYQEYDRLKDQLRAKRLRQGDNESVAGSNGGTATYRARVTDQFAGNAREVLNKPQEE